MRYAHLLTRRTGHCLQVAARAAAPRKLQSVSEWADANRELSSKQSGERGRWRTSRTPFLREIMDCFSATSSVREVVVMKSAQVGVTESMINILGYLIDHAPAPAMVLMPTLDARDKWKLQKLDPLFTETQAIRAIMGGHASRDAANSKDAIDFPGGILFQAGGNSPNSYAQVSVRILLMDDVDRFPAEVGNEGDPISLARNRLKAFARSKFGAFSTPTDLETSIIAGLYEDSDKRRYHVPCPHCGEYQPLEWGGPDKPYGVKWNEALTQAWYLCRECAAEIYEHHKPAMLAGGRWIAENPGHTRRGYHINELYAPIGLGGSWLDLARDWKACQRSVTQLKAFVNTRLGEPWTEPGQQTDPTNLLARLEEYPETIKFLARTFGVDVQKDRLEVTIHGWRAGEECYTLAHIILPGDTARPEVWDQLASELREWQVECGAVDSGYNTSMVYAFCTRHPWAYAIKGATGPGRPIVEDERARRQRLRRQKKKGITVHLVGVDQAKALIYSRLNLQEPGPAYIHFPQDPDFDDEYFAQLTAEKLVTKMRGMRPIAEWKQTRPRNEALDCAIYSLAALRLSGINLAQRATQEGVPKVAAPVNGARRIGRIGLGRAF